MFQKFLNFFAKNGPKSSEVHQNYTATIVCLHSWHPEPVRLAEPLMDLEGIKAALLWANARTT
jgi:hypothetical protein